MQASELKIYSHNKQMWKKEKSMKKKKNKSV